MAKKIKVLTLPNGYSLEVDKQQYMTFNEKELIAAIFYHLLLGKDEYVESDISENLMLAAATWPTVEASVQGNAQLMAEAKAARRDERVARKQNSSLVMRFDALMAEYKEMKANYIKAKAKAVQMDKYKEMSEKAYNLYNREKKYSSDLQKELLKMKRREESRARAAERKKQKENNEETTNKE